MERCQTIQHPRVRKPTLPAFLHRIQRRAARPVPIRADVERESGRPVPFAPPALPGFTATTRRSAPAPRIATLPLTDSAARGSRSRPPTAGHHCSTGQPPHRDTGSHVPHESPDHARATSTPDTTWPIDRHPPGSSQGRKDSLVSMPPHSFRRFLSGSLSLAFVILTCRTHGATFPRRSPPRLLTAAARGGLRPPPAQRPRRATRPADQAPPSLAQHRIQRLDLLHPASFNVRVRTNARDPGPTGPLATFRLAASALAPKAAVLGPATRLPVLARSGHRRDVTG